MNIPLPPRRSISGSEFKNDSNNSIAKLVINRLNFSILCFCKNDIEWWDNVDSNYYSKYWVVPSLYSTKPNDAHIEFGMRILHAKKWNPGNQVFLFYFYTVTNMLF